MSDAVARLNEALEGSLKCFLAVVALSCTPVEWTNEVPSQLLGVWIKQSDEIAAGYEEADTILVTRTDLRLSRYDTDGFALSRDCSPIRQASIQGHSYVLFCGPEHADHIAAKRFLFQLNEGGYAGEIGELVGTGLNNEDAFFSFGHFVKRR